MPDLPTCREALADATQICGNAVQYMDMPEARHELWLPKELRADIQAARAQLDRAERALTGGTE